MCQSKRPGNTLNVHGKLNRPKLLGMDGAVDGDVDSVDAWCQGDGLDVMFCIINLFEGILFGLFTMIMACDQISSIISNTTYIDTLTMNRKQLQKKKKQASSMDNLTFIFGQPFGIGWFLPTGLTPKIRENFKNLCMQF